MKKFICLIYLIVPLIGIAQDPNFTIAPGNKYIEFNKTSISDDLKDISQLRIGEYLTIGNFGLSNGSWIGNNAILNYSSYDNVGSLGDQNIFVPVWDQGTALVIRMHFSDGRFTGYTRQWNSSSQAVNINDFDKSWELGRTNAYFMGTVGIGVSNPGSWRLAVNGRIRAKEIKVETGWSDFVFEKDYNLPTLEEVEKHIREKGHLKDIPSAREVKENGIFLGQMDAKLLQKIEEIILYTIQQEKRIDELEQKNQSLTEVVEEFLRERE